MYRSVFLILLGLLRETIAECQLSSPIRLTSEYAMTLKYKSSNTTLTVELSANKAAYIGFGHSPNGVMLDATVVMGGGDNLDVAKYNLFNRGAGKFPTSRQTLINATFEQSEESSVLTFTKLLKEAEEDEIDGFGENIFIWSLGFTNSLLDSHSHYGLVKISLNPFCDFDDIIVEDIPFKSHFKTHGIMAAVAWGILTPFAIAASVFRRRLSFDISNSKAWMLVHKVLNIMTGIMTVGLVFIAVTAYQMKGQAHFQQTHDRVGLTIMIIVMIQILSAFLRPPPGQKETDDDTEVPDREPESNVKTTVRIWWERFHIIIGILVVALSMYQLYSGEYLYRTKYGGSDISVLFWSWLGVMVILITFTAVKRITGTTEVMPSKNQELVSASDSVSK